MNCRVHDRVASWALYTFAQDLILIGSSLKVSELSASRHRLLGKESGTRPLETSKTWKMNKAASNHARSYTGSYGFLPEVVFYYIDVDVISNDYDYAGNLYQGKGGYISRFGQGARGGVTEK